MIHTLLPPAERKILRREYRLRALCVLLFSLSAAGLIGIGSLLPVYIRADIEKSTAESQLSAIEKSKDLSVSTIQNKVIAGQNLLAIAATDATQKRPSLILEGFIRERGPVRITSLTLNSIASTSAQITVQGIAPTREMLLAFKSRIENNRPGSKVVLPVSELAKATNIQFSLQVNLSIP